MGDADQYVVGQQNMIARFITNVFDNSLAI